MNGAHQKCAAILHLKHVAFPFIDYSVTFASQRGRFFIFFLDRSPVRETGKDTVINECERSPDKHDTEPSAPYLPADRRLPPLRHKA